MPPSRTCRYGRWRRSLPCRSILYAWAAFANHPSRLCRQCRLVPVKEHLVTVRYHRRLRRRRCRYRFLQLGERRHEAALAGGNVVRLNVLRLLLDPAVVHHLRPGGNLRTGSAIVAVECCNKTLPCLGQLADRVRRQERLAESGFVRQRRLSLRRGERAAGERLGILVIGVCAFRFCHREIIAGERIVECGAARLRALRLGQVMVGARARS